MRKICLINPPTSDHGVVDSYFPMAQLVIAGALRDVGVRSVLWDFDYYCFTKGRDALYRDLPGLIRLGVEGAQTEIFGISAVASNFPMAIWIAQEIKRQCPTARIFFGGPQPSSVYQSLLTHFPCVDAVVVGEGEETVAELARENFALEALPQIAGVAFCRDGAVQYRPRPLIKDLDRLPMPDYTLIDFAKYEPLAIIPHFAHIEAGRGCPFTCSFCSTSIMWQRRYRMKSPQRILAEARWLNTHWGITRFDLIHDNWTTSARDVERFCQYWGAEADPQWRWYVTSRVDCLSDEQLTRMTATGLGGIFFGVESGSPKIQQTVGKRLDLQGFEAMVLRVHQLGLDCTTAFIVGFPEEEEEDIDMSVRLAARYKVRGADRVYFSILVPLAGTAICKRYAPHMELEPASTPIYPLYHVPPEVREMIAAHPDLFSFFYHIPHPLLPREAFWSFARFTNSLILHVSRDADLLFTASDRTPMQLFRAWRIWLARRGISETEERWEDRFRSLFHAFLREAVFAANRPVAVPPRCATAIAV